MFQHWDLFNSETLVGQHHRLEGLAGILQVVSESFHEWRFIHEGNSSVASNDSHSLTWCGLENGSKEACGVEPGMASLADLRHQSRGPLGSRKHKLLALGDSWLGMGPARECMESERGLCLTSHGGEMVLGSA